MKKDKHPEYREVLFIDSSTNLRFICGTTAKSEQTEMVDGKEMPVVVLPISSASHPYFVGGKQYVDAEGRVDRFKKRYAAKPEKAKETPEPAKTKTKSRKKAAS
jgi:large subunit ribosomal protein L31